MRILTLDDMMERQRRFTAWFRSHDHVAVFSADQAKLALDELPQFDLVMLDHDLAEEHYLVMSEGMNEEPSLGVPVYSPGTGMEVVDHIISMPVEKRPRVVVIHSYNTVRAQEMYLRLDEAGVVVHRIPFGKNPLGE